jgi:radical SAM superfamily enzyme YgiQ (UPF0313 family)
MMVNNLDILLLHAPPLSTQSPYVGTATIAGFLKSHGYNVSQKDLNILLASENDYFLGRIETESFKKIKFDLISQHLNSYLEDCLALNPKFIGISGLSYYSIPFINYCTNFFHQKKTSIKIIIGGPVIEFGIDSKLNGINLDHCDYVIEGDAFSSLLEILSGKSTEKLHSRGQKIIEFPIPSYDDLPIKLYGKQVIKESRRAGGLVFYLNNSIGCTQKCAFCNVPIVNEKFSIRPPQSVISEIEMIINKYGIYSFEFTDNLVNASIPILRRLLVMLIELKKTHPLLTWYGLAIIREEKYFPKEIFSELTKSGLKLLSYGVESGSVNVLQSMRKKYKPDDLIYTLEQLQLNNIHVTLLFIVGFPTESEEDFQETISLLSRIQQFAKVVQNIRVNTFQLKTKNEVFLFPERFGVVIDSKGEWSSKDVSIAIAEERYKIFVNTVKKLGLPTPHIV